MGKVKETLTKADQLVIDSYKNTMEALADYYGSAFELVLHELTDLDHSIVKIVNGFHSDRKEGGPITDFALTFLEQIDREISRPAITYFSKSKYGKPVKSTTVAIFGENKRIIGLFCINLYLDSPIMSLLDFTNTNPTNYVSENFITDSHELIYKALDKARNDVDMDNRIMVSKKNREIITLLYHKGIFKLKESVQIISKELKLSRNTVYLHIRLLERNK